VEASGVRRPARIYDLRSTFASDALAAGVSVFRLARVMGTSVRMIERHYGALLDGDAADIAAASTRSTPSAIGPRTSERTSRDVWATIGPYARPSPPGHARRNPTRVKGIRFNGSDGARTRDLRRDRPAL
jgi:hypothetical protein